MTQALAKKQVPTNCPQILCLIQARCFIHLRLSIRSHLIKKKKDAKIPVSLEKDFISPSNQSLVSFLFITVFCFITVYHSYFKNSFYTHPATYGHSLFAKNADHAFKQNCSHMLVIHFPLPAFASFVLELEFNFETIAVTGSD